MYNAECTIFGLKDLSIWNFCFHFSFLRFFISDVITPPRLRRYSSYLKLKVESKKGK